jgi:hypothetical protein
MSQKGCSNLKVSMVGDSCYVVDDGWSFSTLNTKRIAIHCFQ